MGSRLRLLSELVSKDAAAIYSLYGLEIKPKWFTVFFALTDGDAKAVTSIAKEIGQTHASVSVIVKEMIKSGIVKTVDNGTDLRKTLVTLSDKGWEAEKILRVQLRDVERAVEQISSEATHDLWRALAEWQRLIADKSILERVAEIKREREDGLVKIEEYKPEYQEAYFNLNKEWIERYWQLEAHDIEQMSNPQHYIIDNGGHIFVALFNGKPVGVVALCRLDNTEYDFEIAKLAVDTSIRRHGIGNKLFEAAIAKAKELGATTLFLESNTRLRPAIALYRKFGFKELAEYHPAYERGDIQMKLKLE